MNYIFGIVFILIAFGESSDKFRKKTPGVSDDARYLGIILCEVSFFLAAIYLFTL